MEYLGALGRLIPLECASSESTAHAGRYRVMAGHDGSAAASLRPTVARSWSISIGTLTDREMAALEGFEHGEWGAGPWHWVPISAQHGNVLTPAESLMAAPVSAFLSQGGPMLASDGTWAGTSVVNTSTADTVLTGGIPVVAGVPVTLAVDVVGDGVTAPQVRLGFTDGSAIVTHTASGITGAGVQRIHVTATPAVNMVSAEIRIRASTMAATRPQVTWTGGPVDWSVGKGCRKAVPTGLSTDLLWSPGAGRSLSDASYAIQELT